MGSFLAFPLAKPPDIFDLSESALIEGHQCVRTIRNCLIWTSLCMVFEVVTIGLHYMTDKQEWLDLKISKLKMRGKQRHLHLGWPWADEDDIYAECHAINVKFCETMHRQNMRSKKEMAMFYEYRRHWSGVVERLKEKYPQWTSKDILNLRYQFEVFVRDQGYLLHYATFNEMLDVFQDDTSPEQRRAMFDSVDSHQCNAINFEEYLQLMNNINIGTPVPRPPGIEKDRDEIMNLVSDLSETYTFTQICYGLF